MSGAITHYESNHVVLAAGAWACTIAGVPRGIPVEPVRGQMAALPWPAGEPSSVLYGDLGYLVPRGGEALVGSTMEHVGFEKGNFTTEMTERPAIRFDQNVQTDKPAKGKAK